jgi:hypothetical protein
MQPTLPLLYRLLAGRVGTPDPARGLDDHEDVLDRLAARDPRRTPGTARDREALVATAEPAR